jgi:hypothetical protein
MLYEVYHTFGTGVLCQRSFQKIYPPTRKAEILLCHNHYLAEGAVNLIGLIVALTSL